MWTIDAMKSKLSLSLRPRTNDINAAMLSQNQNPVEPRKESGKVRMAWRIINNSSCAITTSWSGHNCMTCWLIETTAPSLCFIGVTSRKPPEPPIVGSCAASAAPNMRGWIYSRVWMLRLGCIIRMALMIWKDLTSPGVKWVSVSWYWRSLIAFNPDRATRLKTAWSRNVTHPKKFRCTAWMKLMGNHGCV